MSFQNLKGRRSFGPVGKGVGKAMVWAPGVALCTSAPRGSPVLVLHWHPAGWEPWAASWGRSPPLQEAAPSSPGGRRAAPAPNSHPSAHVTVRPAPLLKHPIIFRIKLQQGVGAETGELGTEGTIKLPVGF